MITASIITGWCDLSTLTMRLLVWATMYDNPTRPRDARKAGAGGALDFFWWGIHINARHRLQKK